MTAPKTQRPSGSVKSRKWAPDRRKAEAAFRDLLRALGIDPNLPALAQTPARAAEAFLDVLTAGYAETPGQALGQGFPVAAPGPVLVTRIPTLFTCPHHLLPARAQVHLGFWAIDRAPGLSRITRMVDVLSHRLVLQEDLSQGLVDALVEGLGVEAAVAIVEAQHSCVAVEDFARHEVVFRTRAAHGPEALVTSLEQQIGASLAAPWTSASAPPSESPASRSRSRPLPKSSGTPKQRTNSKRPPS